MARVWCQSTRVVKALETRGDDEKPSAAARYHVVLRSGGVADRQRHPLGKDWLYLK